MSRSSDLARPTLLALALLASACASPDTNFYDADVGVIAREAQNPISKLTKVGLESNFNFDVGLDDDLQYVGDLSVNLPVALDDDWNIVNAFVLPLIDQPELIAGEGDETGIGNLDYTGWVALDNETSGIFGFGPVVVAPTNSDDQLGPDDFAAGIATIIMRDNGPWVYGISGRNVWNIPGDADDEIGELEIGLYVNYNLDDGWYWTSTPTFVADWEESSSERWTTPIGGGIGRVVEFGSQPVNFSLEGYWNAETPDPQGAEWAIVFDIELLYTKRGYRSWMKKKTVPN